MSRRHRRTREGSVSGKPERIEPDEPIELDITGLILDDLNLDCAIQLLENGAIQTHGLLPWSSNYTFLITVRDAEYHGLGVYKPRYGERPLWDFPDGTLCQREVAAFLVSEALGWSLVPPTVLRDGPNGPGMIQLFVGVDPNCHYFTFKDEDLPEVRRLVALDVLINNADRKSGHVLRAPSGRIWAIDHGVTFHDEPKLRTVIWDYAGHTIPDDIVVDVTRFRQRLQVSDPLYGQLSHLLSSAELRALRRRADELLDRGRFPGPTTYPYIPWPPV